jgi:hypothetical protein
MSEQAGPAATPGRADPRGIARSIIIGAICPYVLFQILSQHGVPTVEALSAGAVFPLGATLVSWLRVRRVDGIGIVMLALIIVGVVTSLISGTVRFFLVKESLLTGGFGVVCLVSLLAPRPLMFYFGRQFATGGDPARLAWYDGLWQYPAFRFRIRLITVVWGVAYLVEALVRVVLSFVLAPAAVIAVSPVFALGVTFLLVTWTIAYSRRVARRGEAARRHLAS